MIQKYDLDKTLEKVDCRYTLVVEVAKRARQIIDGAETLTEQVDPNPVSQAIDEIYADKVTYVRHNDEK